VARCHPVQNGPTLFSSHCEQWIGVPTRWKFHDHTTELYDLHTDPFEQTNIAMTRPDIVVELSRVADDWVTTLPDNYIFKRPTESFDPMEPVQRVACSSPNHHRCLSTIRFYQQLELPGPRIRVLRGSVPRVGDDDILAVNLVRSLIMIHRTI
jgi:hypothetical protein